MALQATGSQQNLVVLRDCGVSRELSSKGVSGIPLPSDRSVAVYHAVDSSLTQHLGTYSPATGEETSRWGRVFKRALPEASLVRFLEARDQTLSPWQSRFKCFVQLAAIMSSIGILAKWGAAVWTAIAAGTALTGGLLPLFLVVGATTVLGTLMVAALFSKWNPPYWAKSTHYAERFFGFDFLQKADQLESYRSAAKSALQSKIAFFSNRQAVQHLIMQLQAQIAQAKRDRHSEKEKQLTEALEELQSIRNYFFTRALTIQ